MAIEKKDRSFDKIFDQVRLEKIPMDYVRQVKVNLIDGTVIDLELDSVRKFDDEADIVTSLGRSDVSDVQIQLDYESIKADISKQVKAGLSKYFVSQDE